MRDALLPLPLPLPLPPILINNLLLVVVVVPGGGGGMREGRRTSRWLDTARNQSDVRDRSRTRVGGFHDSSPHIEEEDDLAERISNQSKPPSSPLILLLLPSQVKQRTWGV
jgi:hypothetical protein